MASSAVGGLLGQVGASAVRTGASLLQGSDGDTAVNITAGYEFYLYKEIEQ